MNKTLSMLLVDDSIRMIACQFTPGGKNYYYKSNNPHIKKDDLVIVQAIGHDKPYDTALVKVSEVDVIVDFSETHEYKWIIDVVNFDSFNQVKEVEKTVNEAIKKKEFAHKRSQLREALGYSDLDFQQLIGHNKVPEKAAPVEFKQEVRAAEEVAPTPKRKANTALIKSKREDRNLTT